MGLAVRRVDMLSFTFGNLVTLCRHSRHGLCSTGYVPDRPAIWYLGRQVSQGSASSWVRFDQQPKLLASFSANSSFNATVACRREIPASHAARPLKRFVHMSKCGSLVIVGIFSLCAVALAWRGGLFAPSLSQLKGTPIEETALVDLQGHTHTFRELRGHSSTLYMWATWCTPCLKHLAQYAKNGPPESFGRFLAIALDKNPSAVKTTLKPIGYDEPVWVATDGMSLIQQRFAGDDRRAVPFIVELDGDGEILAARYGEKCA